MSIWRDIFDISKPTVEAPSKLTVAETKVEVLEGPLGSFLQKVRNWSCPIFGTCDDKTQKCIRCDDKKSSKGIHSVAFTIAVVVLSAKLAKADGLVTNDEIATFKQLFTVPESEQKNVGRLFNQARKETAGFETYAKQLGQMFEDNDPVLADLIGCLFAIAAADGLINEDEGVYLRQVATHFGISDEEFARIASRYTTEQIDDPYIILGASPTDSKAELKAKYRAIVALIHPDKLAAQGLPDERVEQATKQLARVNTAYDIALQRSQVVYDRKKLQPA
ncbi:MAG: TerB family tellurite resistance protein [Alphaproteobacteria bacterium]